MKRQTLSVLVEDKPVALTRVTAVFARRAFNINSLAVGPSERPGFSRITIVTTATTDEALKQIKNQLSKLINVIDIAELPMESSVQRDHILIKVKADVDARIQVTQAVDLFRAQIVDVSQESLIIEATGNPAKLQALLEVLEPFTVQEIVQSGNIAMRRDNAAVAAPQVGAGSDLAVSLS